MHYGIQAPMCWVFHRIVAQFLFAAVPVAEAQAGLLEQVPVRDAVAAGQDALVAAVAAGSSSGVFGPASQRCLTTSSLRQVFP